MKQELKLKITTENAEKLYNALTPELKDVNSKRTHVSYEYKNNEFIIAISSEDLTALRAAVNSHILWLKTFEKVN